jgi:hypothetical protein
METPMSSWLERRCAEVAFLVEAFDAIEGPVIKFVRKKMPAAMPSFEACGRDAEYLNTLALYAAVDAIEDAGLTAAAISAVAERGPKAALPFLRQAAEQARQAASMPVNDSRANNGGADGATRL